MAIVADQRGLRVFVNDLDSYESKWIAEYLSGDSMKKGREGEEEEGEEEGEEGARKRYQVVGTVSKEAAARYEKPAYIHEILKYETRPELIEHIMECDYIVFNINTNEDQIDEANAVVEELAVRLENVEKRTRFILLSTVMTWAKTKPTDPEDPEVAFIDSDYRKRKPHPNFKKHSECEKNVLKFNKKPKGSNSKLQCFVVASGVIYGKGESVFHFFFKHAWHNAPTLPVFGGEGANVLPTIHIVDLASVVQCLMSMEQKPKLSYLVAVDHSNPPNSLEVMIKAISAALTTGKLSRVPVEEAFKYRDIKQSDFDQLTVDLRMDGDTIRDFPITWHSENGFVESIATLVNEYKDVRKLQPLKIFIQGPPAVGKTSIAKQLAQHYKLHHLHIKGVIDEAIESKERNVARADAGADNEEEEDEDAGAKLADDQETLEAVKEQIAQNNGRINDNYVIKFFNERLISKPCQNQGYILDGWPKTREQAMDLFKRDDEGEEEEGEGVGNKLLPEHVISLDAPDDFLKDRIMKLPESVVQGTHNTEEGLIRRLGEFRRLGDYNTDEENVLNYFDEIELHPMLIDVSKSGVEVASGVNQNGAIVQELIKKMGPPRNYGMTVEEKEESDRQNELAKQFEEEKARGELEENERKEREKKEKRQQDWTNKLEQIKREEADELETRSIPLRNYLMAHVMPTLTQGLIECTKTRPEDPIDFLAEYLFSKNPQID